MNHDIDVICQWDHQWKMGFNPGPTKQADVILFSHKKSNPIHPQLIFNGSIVVKANEQKHLCFILHSKLTFKNHLNVKIITAKKNIGIMKHLAKFLTIKALDQMYKILVLPHHLEYYEIIYHKPPQQNQLPFDVSLNSVMEKS